jgi:hypothetical protein
MSTFFLPTCNSLADAMPSPAEVKTPAKLTLQLVTGIVKRDFEQAGLLM